MFKIIQKRNFLFILSLAILVPGMFFLVRDGLKVGLDFTGGSRMTVSFAVQPRPDGPAVTQQLESLKVGDITAQTAGSSDMLLRMPTVTNDQRQSILSKLNEKYPGTTEKDFESVGPVIGQELLHRAISALIFVLIAIVLYMSWAFRKVNVGTVPAWVYGLSAIIALAHDVLIVIGAFAFLGTFFHYEVDSLFVTALLTVLGFSVHDTIVVFDRIRERLLIGAESSFEETVNVSLNQTLVRSLNTSLTTLLVLSVLFIFGGETIRPFILALLIGIISGTYSSIFVASPLLVVYEHWKHRRR